MSVILLGFEPGTLDEKYVQRIREIAPEMQLLVTNDRAEIEAALDEIEIAVRRLPRELIASAPRLRWFQQWGAGADWLLRYPEVREKDFVLTNTSGLHAIPISEHILAMMLAMGRRLHYAVRAQSRRTWERPATTDLFELAGKTMLLLGVGAIGERTAQLASALGMRVWGIRRNPALSVAGVEAMYGPDRLLELLPQADFVVVILPLTEETQGMIGERELRAMRPTAYIINVGRGGVIQEQALIRALQEGWIAGAGLDVFAEEPLPADSPLWDMENVVLTAHYAGLTPHYDARAMEIFLDNLERYVSGKPLRNVVDKRLGY